MQIADLNLAIYNALNKLSSTVFLIINYIYTTLYN